MNLALLSKNSALVALKNDIARASLTHAYMLLGEDEETRKGMFTMAAINILCHSACMSCDICSQIISDNYVDIMTLDGADGIKVKEITALNDNTAIQPTVGAKKLYFIDNADKLSVQAQNKMLKTLEEPPSYVHIFLGVNNESGLLSTIKSRAKKLYIDSLDISDIKRELIDYGIDKQLAEVSAVYSLGNLSKAYKFAENESYSENYNKCFDLMLRLKNSTQIVEFLFTPIFSKENLPLTLDFLEIILSDVMKLTAKSNASISAEQRLFDLKTIAEGFNPRSASMAINVINDSRKKLNSNINSVSVAENLLFGILEAKYKWQL